MNIGFLITTYNRQEACQRLVDSLQGLGDIVVVSDGCDYDISGCKQLKQKHHYGRQGYWKTVNNLFKHKGDHKYYFMLPDDFLPTENMVNDAIKIWNRLYDSSKICLNLHADRIGVPCWTGVYPKDKGDVWLSHWVDMCFMCQNQFFSVLGHIPDIKRGRMGSSGVGAYISRYLKRYGYNQYQVKKSLITVQEEHCISQMHG